MLPAIYSAQSRGHPARRRAEVQALASKKKNREAGRVAPGVGEARRLGEGGKEVQDWHSCGGSIYFHQNA